jgi:hypothetical protein
MLEPRSIPHDPTFHGLFNYVYIDEKWFNITENTLRYYTACRYLGTRIPSEPSLTSTARVDVQEGWIPSEPSLTSTARVDVQEGSPGLIQGPHLYQPQAPPREKLRGRCPHTRSLAKSLAQTASELTTNEKYDPAKVHEALPPTRCPCCMNGALVGVSQQDKMSKACPVRGWSCQSLQWQ